ncbi:MAG: hypothetical protein GF334_05705 [Candidatus Altiarchaeales archaeon]|nr:hypothetical protein [Candidatus Altiarchaeales archaeon]
MTVHLIFLVALFLRDTDILGFLWAMILPVAALFASHLLSFYKNFLKKKEYKTFSRGPTPNVMPYHRIFLMHILIIFIGAAE